MHKGNIDGIRLWYWFKVRYESAAKLYPLRSLYWENIRSIKLQAVGLLINYIEQFQGLEIIWQEINKNVEPKDRIVTQMVKHIEDTILYSPCEIIKNWDTHRRTFCGAIATLRSHKISKLSAQTKR